MMIAFASGKGGTGKTTVAVNLAAAYRAAGRPVQLLDCDVEAPNCHLFLRPTEMQREPVTVPTPRIDRSKCDLCGRCVQLCAYGALARLKDDVIVFPELCHACGGCVVICPRDAIVEEPREIGEIHHGMLDGLHLVTGTLRVGEPQAPPVIEAVKSHAHSAPEPSTQANQDQHQHQDQDPLVLLDVPPGTSCPVVAAVRHVDYVVLVAESTPFGVHDVCMVVEALSELDLPLGLVVNRAGLGDDTLHQFAAERRIPILAELPYERRVAEHQAGGGLAYDVSPEWSARFDQLAARVAEQVQTCRS